MLFLWFLLILTVEEQWLSMWNRNLHDCIHISICPIALWTSLQPENTSTTEMNMDWKFLQIYTPYIFMELKEPLNWLKRKNKRDRRKLKRNCKTLSKVKCIQIYCKKCLILDVSAIERCPLHGGFVMRV